VTIPAWQRVNHSSGFDSIVAVLRSFLIHFQGSGQGGQLFVFDRQSLSRHSQPTTRQRRTDLHLGFDTLHSRDRSEYVRLLCSPRESPLTLDILVNSLKWKPPSENSVDFKLILRFPPLPGSPPQPDFHAKPLFTLHVWCGGEGASASYEPWDTMRVSDDEWERYVASREQMFRFSET